MCWEGTETRVLNQLSFSIARDVGSVGMFALKSPCLWGPLQKLVVFCSWLGMLPGTWAYVSAGAIGRAFIVGSYSFSILTFFVIFPCFKSASNTIWFCCMVQGLACFHRAHRTAFQNQQSVLYVSGLERTLRIWDEIEGSTCCGILQNGTHYTLWRVLLSRWRAEYRLEQILVQRNRYQAHTISGMWAM